MKSIILILSLILVSVASAETKKENKPLKNKAIIEVLDQSLTAKLEAHSNELFSSFDGVIKEPRITSLTKSNGKVVLLEVSLKASFSTFDYDFGDPVEELIETLCRATLTKGTNGYYSAELTQIKCEENPQDYIY